MFALGEAAYYSYMSPSWGMLVREVAWFSTQALLPQALCFHGVIPHKNITRRKHHPQSQRCDMPQVKELVIGNTRIPSSPHPAIHSLTHLSTPPNTWLGTYGSGHPISHLLPHLSLHTSSTYHLSTHSSPQPSIHPSSMHSSTPQPLPPHIHPPAIYVPTHPCSPISGHPPPTHPLSPPIHHLFTHPSSHSFCDVLMRRQR